MIQKTVTGLAVALLALSLCAQATAQSQKGTFTGIVRDEKGKPVKKVTVRAVNADTNETVTTITNRKGSYKLVVTPGSRYAISATRLEPKVLNFDFADMAAVGSGEVRTINFKVTAIRVIPPSFMGSIVTMVEVESPNLPLEGADPLALISTLPAYSASPLGHEYDTIGGLPIRTVNTTRDGFIVADSFNHAGFSSVTTLNPDMISEIRLIHAPVDAEAGNGNGQVQITTKSGTNRSRWNLQTDLRPSALNALGPDPSRRSAPFGSTFQYIANVSGPVRKNHIFYFVSWDQQIHSARPGTEEIPGDPRGFGGYLATPVLTDFARNGIFRFWDGWNSGDASTPDPTFPDSLGGAWPIHPDGIAVAPRFRADSVTTPYKGTLNCFSVFGNIKLDGSPFTPADCGTYVPNMYIGSGDPNDPSNYEPDWAHPKQTVAILRNGPWDSFSRLPDRTGYIQRLLGYMPHANFYFSNVTNGGGVVSAGADGLNRAAFAWVRGQTGLDNENTFRGNVFGSGLHLDQASVTHRVINAKFDANLNAQTRLSVGLSFQKDRNSRIGLQSVWPDGIDGYSIRLPHVMTANLQWVLSPNLVNETRAGVAHNRSTTLPPWDNPSDDNAAALARSFLQQGWIDPRTGETTPVYYAPGVGSMDFSSNVLAHGFNAGSGPCTGSSSDLKAIHNCETGSTLYQLADTVSWNHGPHSFRVGAEWRFLRAWEVESAVIPSATAGSSAGTSSTLGLVDAFPELPGRLQTAATDSASLLYFLSGSVASVSQPFWANSVDNFRDGTWESWSDEEGRKIRRTVQNQFAFFLKDDWKLSKRLTLNLGLRYENYGNLHTQGYDSGFQDAGYGLFGASRIRGKDNPFDYWLTPGNTYVTGYGLSAPAINVAGAFLPDGRAGYIPGACDYPGPQCGVPGASISPGGLGSQTIPGSSAAVFTSTVACVYGVQQSPLLPLSTCDPSLLTTRIFNGPGSDHPGTPPLYRDSNHFGPAVGFSWRLPLGLRTVLIRGGVQVTFDPSARAPAIATGVGGQPNQNLGLDETAVSCWSTASCLGVDTGKALTLADLPNVAPFVPAAVPTVGTSAGATSGARSLAVQFWGSQRAVSATAYAPDYRDPYTTNVTLSASTNLTRRMSFAMSYVGTLGRKRPTAIDLNTPNVYYNPELLDALTRTRAGEDAPLFDQMLAGLNLSGLNADNGYGNVGTCVTPAEGFAPGAGGGAGNCPVGAYYQSGSAHLRRSPAFRADLANGNFAAVASTLATFDDFTEGSVISASTNWRSLLEGNAVRNGCDRLANATSSNRSDLISGSATTGNTRPVRCFPEDYIVANPALDKAIYKAGWGFTNYHHLQAQLTVRGPLTTLQATYVFSRLLALPRDFYQTNTAVNDPYAGVSVGSVSGFSDPRSAESRRRDYGVSSTNPNHALRINGVSEFQFGEGKPLLGHASGWVRQLVAGWRFGYVFNAQSGLPFSITAGDMLYGLSSGTEAASGLVHPDVVSTLWLNPQGRMRRNGPEGSSTYFGNPSPFALIRDPQCDRNVGGATTSDPGNINLSAYCSLKALVMKVTPGTPGANPLSSSDPSPVLIMLQNPQPGNQGTLSGQTMRQPGRFSFDASLSKTFAADQRAVEFRVVAINALNHANSADVSLNLGPNGRISEQSNAALAALSTVGRRVQFGIRLIDLF